MREPVEGVDKGSDPRQWRSKAAEVAELEADEDDRDEMLEVAAMMESLR